MTERRGIFQPIYQKKFKILNLDIHCTWNNFLELEFRALLIKPTLSEFDKAGLET